MKKLITPAGLAVVGLLLASMLTVSGIYILAGLGWALITCSVPFYLLSLIIFRGLSRG